MVPWFWMWDFAVFVWFRYVVVQVNYFPFSLFWTAVQNKKYDCDPLCRWVDGSLADELNAFYGCYKASTHASPNNKFSGKSPFSDTERNAGKVLRSAKRSKAAVPNDICGSILKSCPNERFLPSFKNYPWFLLVWLYQSFWNLSNKRLDTTFFFT